MQRLEIDLVPMALHGTSIAKTHPTAWKKIRRYYYALYGDTCTICEYWDEERTEIEAHEVWEYTITGPDTGVQRLKDVDTLCRNCHRFKHYGRSQIVLPPPDMRALNEHAMKVNGWTRADLKQHIKEKGDEFRVRNEIIWEQDLKPWLPYLCGRCHKVTRGLNYDNGWLCKRCTEAVEYEEWLDASATNPDYEEYAAMVAERND